MYISLVTILCLFIFSIISSKTVFAGPQSTSFELKTYEFGAGGIHQEATSSSYAMQANLGTQDSSQASSTSYQANAGYIFANQANVPPAPSLTNPSNWYNKLKLIIANGGNPSDSEFAIAISSDAFVSDTKYIQSDHTSGADPVWQTYTSWGEGDGFNIIGLLPNQTYTVKVAAKQGKYTATGYGPTAQENTEYPFISFSISGVTSNTSIEGITTDITTTSTQVVFGELSFDEVQEGASLLSVTTTASSGYTVAVEETGSLTTVDNIVFPQVSGTNTTPDIWPTSVLSGAYGYHTSDHSLGTGNTTRFTDTNTFAKFETVAQEVAYNNQPISDDTTYMIYSIETGKGQPAGSYSHTITYLATGVF